MSDRTRNFIVSIVKLNYKLGKVCFSNFEKLEIFVLNLNYGRTSIKNDFYEWAYSDFLVNNQRGHLAEYIIAKALNTVSQKG